MARIRLYGIIGWEVTARDLVAALDDLDGEDVDLHIASPGGFVDDALALYTAIRSYKGKTRVIVDGLAASAASWISMAADEIWMGPSSLMMVHGPWTWSAGDAAQLRADADVLDTYAGIMRRAYGRHGYEGDDLLVDGEHWFNADEALAALLITGVLEDDTEEDDAKAQVRSLLTSKRAAQVPAYELPADMAAHLSAWALDNEDEMKIKRKRGLGPLAVAAADAEALADAILAEDPTDEEEEDDEEETAMEDEEDEEEEEETAASARKAERERVGVITSLADRGYFSAVQRDKLIKKGVSADRARAVALELGARNQTKVTAIRGGDGVEKRRAGMVEALMGRGLGQPVAVGNEWRGRSILRMAAACHPELGRQYDGSELIRAVLAHSQGQRYQASADAGITHGTGDFIHVLGDSIHRSMLLGYGEVEKTYEGWTNRAELRDFRPTPRVDLGAFQQLAEVAELDEIPSTTITDRGVTATLKKYGGRFGISFEALTNDDLRVFTEVPRKQGQAAARTVANHVYNVFASNGPTIEGFALFSTDHDTTAADELSALGLGERRAAMRRQTMPAGNGGTEITNIMPKFLIVPPELYGYALELVSAVLQDGGGTNVWAGSLQIIEEPRLTVADDWFLAADGAMVDTVEVAFLNGNETPMLDQLDGWTTLGTEYRVVLPFAVTLRDFRGLQRGTGGPPS